MFLHCISGRESLSRWIEDPSDPNVTLFWKLIDGESYLYSKFEFYLQVVYAQNVTNIAFEYYRNWYHSPGYCRTL